MSRFQVSKFKNIELNQTASFGASPLCNIGEWPNYGTHSQFIDSGGCCVATYVGNDKVSVNSSLPQNSHLFDIHCPSLCDISLSPFRDDLLSITSEDKYVHLYRLPLKISSDNDFVSTENCAQEILKIPPQNNLIVSSRFHPLVPDLIVQASEGEFCLVKFDTSSEADCKKVFSKRFPSPEDLVSFAFSNTSLDLAVVNEKSGLHIYDPRTDSTAQENNFRVTLRDNPRLGFLENGGSPCLLSTSVNQVQIWDRRSFDSPISTTSIPSDSKLIPLIDYDTGLIFVVSFNSGLVTVSEEKQLLSGNGFNSAYSVYLQQKFRGVTLASKRNLQYDVPEVDRLYALTKTTVVPMQFIVPRKVPEKFFGEYYPPTKSPFNQKLWSELIVNDDLIKVSKLNLHPDVNPFAERFALASKPEGSSENGKELSSSPKEEIPVPETIVKVKQYLPQTDKVDGNIVPKCKFLRGTVDLKSKMEFSDEVYDGLASMRLMKTGRNMAVLPIGRTACDTLALVNLTTGEQQTFQASSIITDFAVDPFVEEGGQLICVGTNSGDIYLIDANINEHQMNISSSHLSACHRGAIVKAAFHPLFANTLITVGKEDNLVQIWSVTNDRKMVNICSQTLVPLSDTISEICWSKHRNGGNRLAVLLKTKDSIEKLVIFEYCRRAFTLIHEIVLPKFCFMVSLEWIVRDEFILATGRHRGDMKLFIWDTMNDYRLVIDTSVDSNPYSLYSHFDEDTGTLLLIPKGDRQIHIFGLQFKEDCRALEIQRFDPFQTNTRVLACSFGQKINCDVMKMEILNGHLLSDGFIAPFSLVVPRKNMEDFDDSLFPTTVRYWKPYFNELFEMNEPTKYDVLERHSLQPAGTACVSSVVNDSNQNRNNLNRNAKLNITINQAIDNPYLAMQVKDQIESSLSTMISNITVEDDDLVRRQPNFSNDTDDEEADWN